MPSRDVEQKMRMNKARLILCALLLLAGITSLLYFRPTSINASGELNDPEKLTVFGLLRTGGSRSFGLDEIKKLKTFSFNTTNMFSMKKGGKGRRYEVVALQDLISECMPAIVPQSILLVGADGYRAEVAQKDITDRKICVAFHEDGQLIGSEKGPFRIVVDGSSLSEDERKRLDAVWVWSCQKIYLGKQPTSNRETIELWTPIPNVIMAQIEATFEKHHPEIDLEVKIMGATTLNLLVNDILAGNATSTPDMIWLSEPSDAERLKMAGFLERYFPKNVEKISPFLKDPDGYYTGVRVLRLGLACNSNFPLPTDMSDLLRDEYKGKIGWVKPGQIGTYLLAALTGNDELGWNFVRQIFESTPKKNVFQSFGDSCDNVAAGKLAIGISLDYLVFNWTRANPDLPIVFIQPPQLAVSLASPIAIFRNSTRFKKCSEFVDELLGDELQLVLQKNGFTPTRILKQNQTVPTIEPVDHQYIAVNAPVLRALYDELEGQIYGR